MKRRLHRRLKPLKHTPGYNRLWRIVDGAVKDALQMHPDYVGHRKRSVVRISLNKRIVGAILSSSPTHVEQEGAKEQSPSPV